MPGGLLIKQMNALNCSILVFTLNILWYKYKPRVLKYKGAEEVSIKKYSG